MSGTRLHAISASRGTEDARRCSASPPPEECSPTAFIVLLLLCLQFPPGVCVPLRHCPLCLLCPPNRVRAPRSHCHRSAPSRAILLVVRGRTRHTHSDNRLFVRFTRAHMCTPVWLFPPIPQIRHARLRLSCQVCFCNLQGGGVWELAPLEPRTGLTEGIDTSDWAFGVQTSALPRS